MQLTFSVKAGEFEGPLELLLSLIEERKMLISDVSLSRVADDFLEYLRVHIALPIGQAAQFVLIAATLLLLKSKSLLPILSFTDEEEGDIKDLEFRLSLYQLIRNAARGMASLTRHMFVGEGSRIADPVFTPGKDLSVASITEGVERVLMSAPAMFRVPEVSVQTVVTLEEMMKRLSERIEKVAQMTFRDFSGSAAADRRELVVGFLAMLELVKRGLLAVEQGHLFGDITMNYNGAMRAPRFE